MAALAAAFVAYLAALKQVWLSEAKIRQEREAFSSLLWHELRSFLKKIATVTTALSDAQIVADTVTLNFRYIIPDLLKDVRWNDLTILGPEIAVSIMAVKRSAQELIDAGKNWVFYVNLAKEGNTELNSVQDWLYLQFVPMKDAASALARSIKDALNFLPDHKG